MLQKLVALKFLTLAFVCLATEAQVIQKGRSCPSNWIWQPSNPSVCYYISTERLGFHAADKSCKDKTSSLALALSSDEHVYISGELIALKRRGCNAKEDCVNFWIGLQLLSSKSNWTHVDGSQISTKTSFWDKGYPSGKGNCGLMHVQDSDREVIAYWRDENCDEPRPYICKQDCPVGFSHMPGGSNCYKLNVTFATWEEASTMCQKLHPRSTLAIVTNPAENEAVTKFLQREFSKNGSYCISDAVHGQNVWIGGQRNDSNRCDVPFVWRPAHNVELPMQYTNWGHRQPDCGDGRETCMHISQGWGYKWNDQMCSSLRCFLCQASL